MSRTHTGRRRNDAARAAILDAAAELLAGPDPLGTTIDAIAARAGVGKQTIYRWWPSKGAVLLETLTVRADLAVPPPGTGTLLGDLTAFLTATFRSATAARPVLAAVMAEAQRDAAAAELFGEFTRRRRDALRAVLAAHRAGGDLDLLVDQAFGLMWYRMLTGHAELTDHTAAAVAAALCRQAG